MPTCSLRFRVTAAAVALAVAFTACDDGAAGPTATEDLPSLSINRTAAPPGAPLRITDVDVPAGEISVLIGGIAAPVLFPAADTILTSVPLFVDESGSTFTPGDKVDVVLTVAGQPVAGLRAALAIEPLPEAPLSSARVLEDLDAIAESLTRISWQLQGEPGVEAQYWSAVAGAMHELITGDDPRSLANVLAALGPAEREVLDGWLVTSGVLAAIEQLAGQVSVVADASPSFASGTVASASGFNLGGGMFAASLGGDPMRLSGLGLAYRMQLHEVALLFGNTVVAPTATTYANTVGMVAGLAGVGGVRFPPAAIIGAIVAMSDFVINKVAVGLLPAKIDSLTLDVSAGLIPLGGVTDARVRIIASNDPPPIGVQDMVGVILATLGTVPTKQEETLRTVLGDAANFVFSTMQSFIAQYANANPGANLDVNLLSVPTMQWEATLYDPQLVERISLTPDIIEPLPDQVNWRGSNSNRGDGRIYARTAIGPVFIPLPPGVEYTGGVFGHDVVASETITIEVGGSFDGQFVGTYSGTGCRGGSESGTIAFQIQQNGPVLGVVYALEPHIDGLSHMGGEALITSETLRSFNGSITLPSGITGTINGQLSDDRREINGSVQGRAGQCGFSATYRGVRQ